MLCGMAGVLYRWSFAQREKMMWLESFLRFLKKSRYVMQSEKIRLVDYFKNYIAQDSFTQSSAETSFASILEEIINRLSTNTYPNGQMVWEEVFKEKRQKLQFDNEVFQILVQAANGFFGGSREENICFLEKSIEQLEQQQKNMKEKNMQERKVWIPVGMLGVMMLIILFL